jgi:hypothetical protein
MQNGAHAVREAVMPTRKALFIAAGTTVALYAPVALSEETYLESPPPEFPRECGVKSSDLFVGDLVENSENPVGYCDIDNNDWAWGLQSTLSFYVGDEYSTGLSFSVEKPFSAGPFSALVFAEVYYYPDAEIETVYTAGAEGSFDVLGALEVGVLYEPYWGSDDYEETTTSAFVRTDLGPIDLEIGYSSLDSDAEGPYFEAGWTQTFESGELRLFVEGFRIEYEDEGVPISEEYFAGGVSWRF